MHKWFKRSPKTSPESLPKSSVNPSLALSNNMGIYANKRVDDLVYGSMYGYGANNRSPANPDVIVMPPLNVNNAHEDISQRVMREVREEREWEVRGLRDSLLVRSDDSRLAEGRRLLGVLNDLNVSTPSIPLSTQLDDFTKDRETLALKERILQLEKEVCELRELIRGGRTVISDIDLDNSPIS